MIFVTVGSSTKFNRLIRAVDEWAGSRGRSDIVAQIGSTDYRPANIKSVELMDPSEFRNHMVTAELIVAHAGMGTIITALELGKPILVMPRREYLHETRNDHQVATVNQFARREGIIVAMDEKELFSKLDQAEMFSASTRISREASAELISTVRSFIHCS